MSLKISRGALYTAVVMAGMQTVACVDESASEAPPTKGDTSVSGLSLTKQTALEPSSDCPAGGYNVEYGVDDNDSGTLESSEVSTTLSICNGVDGSRGEDGHAVLSQISTEEPGENCAAGGIKIDLGHDKNESGELDQSEIQTTGYACNGEAGTNGQNGQDGADGSDGANGQDGADGSDGEDGLASLIRLVPYAPDLTCEYGGTSIQHGLDLNRNLVLDTEEIEGSAPVCSDTCGSFECGGSCGTCDADVADSCTEGMCACGEGAPCESGEICSAGVCVPPPSIECADATNTGIAGSYAFTFADVTGDDSLDLITSSNTDVTVATGLAGTTFSVTQTLDSGQSIYGLAAGDVDDDGDLDVLTAGPNGSASSMNAVFVNAEGTLEAGTTMFTSHSTAFYGFRVVSADFDGDLIDDVVWDTGNSFRVAFGAYDSAGSPDAFPLAPTTYNRSSSGNAYITLVRDVDGDNDLDLIFTDGAYSTTYDGAVSIYLNDGSGVFSELSINNDNTAFFSGDYVNPFYAATADFNNDGKLDIAFANYSVAQLGVILALRTSEDGDPPTYSFSKPDLGVANGDSRFGIAAGDFDNDGNADLVAGPYGSARLVKGAGDGTFAAGSCSFGVVSRPIAEDVNGDGNLDLAYVSGSNVMIRFAN